jgi:hypothetical protein
MIMYQILIEKLYDATGNLWGCSELNSAYGLLSSY